jgi:hypothetical protein
MRGNGVALGCVRGKKNPIQQQAYSEFGPAKPSNSL